MARPETATNRPPIEGRPAEFPPGPVAAATHPDPYPYYVDLVARRPFYRDEALGMWVASSAEAVEAVLASPHMRVRPPGEPVPRALLGSPAAEIFRRLVRMDDGPSHCPFKRSVSATLDSVDRAWAAGESETQARALAEKLRVRQQPGAVSELAFRLPAYVTASLLGVPAVSLGVVAALTSDFVRCLAPASTADEIERGKGAAAELLDLFDALAGAERADERRPLRGDAPRDGLLAVLAGEAGRDGADPAVVANAIGFLSQSYEATAGLIGNTLLALATRPALRRACVGAAAGAGDGDLLEATVLEAARHDSPVQNTRRFAGRDCAVAGREVRAGDGVLVVLAAANRDPAANADPHAFDPARRSPRLFTFGAGAHACAGRVLAAAIARAGVAGLLRSGVDLEPLAATVRYRPSANARVPVWGP